MFREKDWWSSSRLHWANYADWYVPCFSYSTVRPLTHCIVSGNLSQARSWFFKVKISISDRNADFSPSHLFDILDAHKQIHCNMSKKSHMWQKADNYSIFRLPSFWKHSRNYMFGLSTTRVCTLLTTWSRSVHLEWLGVTLYRLAQPCRETILIEVEERCEFIIYHSN